MIFFVKLWLGEACFTLKLGNTQLLVNISVHICTVCSMNR